MPLEDSFRPHDDSIDVPTVPLEGGSGGTDLNVGEMVGPYQLKSLLGEGGMGMVWLAEQEKPVRRRVAIKVIKPGMDSRAVLARFEAERQALAVMDHPCIAKVLDAGTTPRGLPYFVMELVKGEPITRFCDRERLNVRERVRLLIRVCEAIQHAHSKGIIHRDIKPGNVMVTFRDGKPRPVVIDFGVAKALDQRLTEKTIFTEQGRVIGTPEYMSPEQAEMSGLDIDTRSDIYSLGVLLYQLLTGELPFERERIRQAAFSEVQRMIREEEPPKPSTRFSATSKDGEDEIADARSTVPHVLVRSLRGGLDWIVMRCLEKSRARRYETANGLGLDLQRFLEDEPVMAGPPTVRYRVGRFIRRHRGPVLAASLFLVLLVAAMVISLVLLASVEVQRRRAEDALRASRDLASTMVIEVSSTLNTIPGTSDATRQLLSQGVDILEEIDSNSETRARTPDLARDIAIGHLGIGDALAAAGETSMAWRQYQVAQEYISQALQLEPDHAPSLREQAVLLTNLSELDRMDGRPEDSSRKLMQGQAILNALLEKDADNLQYHRDLCVNLSQQAHPFVISGENPERVLKLVDAALPHAQLVMERDPVVANEPDTVKPMDRLATLLQYRGLAYKSMDRLDEATKDLLDSLTLIREAHAINPINKDIIGNRIAAQMQYRDLLKDRLGAGESIVLDEVMDLTRGNIRLADELRELDPQDPEITKTAAMERVNLAALNVMFIGQNESSTQEARRASWERCDQLASEIRIMVMPIREKIYKVDPRMEAWLLPTTDQIQALAREELGRLDDPSGDGADPAE